MTYRARHPAAFINVIADEGTKAEAVEWLQRTWDELCDLRQGHVVLERFVNERAAQETAAGRKQQDKLDLHREAWSETAVGCTCEEPRIFADGVLWHKSGCPALNRGV